VSLAVVYSRAAVAIEAPEVVVEVHVAGGLPGMTLVGLPETAVRESKDRVRGAIQNSGFEFPVRRITVNLAPADLPKEGGRFDLPIALGILAATGQLPLPPLAHYEFAGELALSGALRPVRGVLPLALQARAANRTLILPVASASEAALVEGADVLAADHLLAVCAHLNGSSQLARPDPPPCSDRTPIPDLSDVQGQLWPRRALEIAAAGGHSLLLYGPPGTGKTMLASRLPGILPPMTESEAVASAAVASISDRGFDPRHWKQRPFRAPHHTASAVALVGGGSQPRPGEISLAHEGVLFLDELPEFSRQVLEVLREPLESGEIVIVRATRRAQFPARFQLIAAMNPCPCGYLGHPDGRCHCSSDQIRRYRSRLSGPLLDRIDLHVEVPALPLSDLQRSQPGEESAAVRARVIAARQRQQQRSGCHNARLEGSALLSATALADGEQTFLHYALERLGLSARAYHRVLRVARTIADLAASAAISRDHLSEAIAYRQLDRPLGD